MRGLFAENAMPASSVVDAGAAEGTEACIYGEHAPDRLIHAVDPIERNLVDLQSRMRDANITNVVALHAGLGDKTVGVGHSKLFLRAGHMAQEGARGARRASFPTYRLDDLFTGLWSGERLGFAHLDLEGFELLVLRGARDTIMKDRPIFTVEVFVHNKPKMTEDLLAFAASLGYQTWLVEEQCGMPADCRNV